MTKLYRIITSIWLTLTIVFSIGVGNAYATGVYDMPIVRAGEPVWVVDEADTLSRATEAKLDDMFDKLAQATGTELRVITLRRLDYGATIDSFTDEVFEKWYPTPEEQENQVLLTLDTLTNRSGIHVAESLQSLLTPEIIESVSKETIGFALKNQQYNQAIVDAGDRMIAILSGQEDPGPPEIQELNIEGTFSTAEETDDGIATIWIVLLVLLATVIPMVTYFWYVGFPGS
ncbi:MAG: photosystem II repair protein Psb32 [Cyanobacterium sp.]